MFAFVQHNFKPYTLALVGLGGLLASYFLVWKNQTTTAVNFIDGDPEFYYYYLQATFHAGAIPDYEWLKTGTINTITHHPVGLSVLLLPFYLLATLFSVLLSYSTDGLSLPYQLSLSLAALSYALIGLNYLMKFFKLQSIPDRQSNVLIILLFFGTTLFQYTVVEPAMSHVYSFAAISIFLYTASLFVNIPNNKHLLLSTLSLGFILLIRPNNILILLFVPFLFSNANHFITTFKGLLKNKVFYSSIGIILVFVTFQLIVWASFEKSLFSDRYAAYGFDWLHPHLKEVLFGFEAGFFIYTPLAFLFVFGLIPWFKESRYKFFILFGFSQVLIYFFSAYSAYTYFDGLGIRVLVDYYGIFALLGAKLFASLSEKTLLYYSTAFVALFFVLVNLIYTYQSSTGILLRAGMTFDKWKHVFLRTSPEYRNSLGGMNDYPPYSRTAPVVIRSQSTDLKSAFNYEDKEYGVGLRFDSLGFSSNRIFLTINCTRKEIAINSSNRALVCVSLEDATTHKIKSYFQFRLNETPSEECCKSRSYHYSANMQADIKASDDLLIYVWNPEKQSFTIEEFSAELYNYNYQIATP